MGRNRKQSPNALVSSQKIVKFAKAHFRLNYLLSILKFKKMNFNNSPPPERSRRRGVGYKKAIHFLDF